MSVKTRREMGFVQSGSTLGDTLMWGCTVVAGPWPGLGQPHLCMYLHVPDEEPGYLDAPRWHLKRASPHNPNGPHPNQHP